MMIFLVEADRAVAMERLREMASSGTLLLRVGGKQGNRLYMNDLSAKSDWYEGRERRTNPAPLQLHGKLKAWLTKQLHRGVLVTNIKSADAEPELDRKYLLSSGAVRFHYTGGELMQFGVENIRFAPPPEPPPQC